MPNEPMNTVRRMTARMLGKTLYVVHTVPVAPPEQAAAMLPAHLEHQVRLEKAGIMFGAGPLMNEDGSPGGGLIVIRAESFEHARSIVDEDPMHKAGLRTYTVRRWSMNEGSYTLKVNYSDQSVSIA